MTLHRINDFRATPSWYEYIIIYLVSSITVITVSFAFIGKVTLSSAALMTLLSLIFFYIFITIRRIRKVRAIQFFNSVIKQYPISQLEALKMRFCADDIEYELIEKRISYIKSKPEQTPNSDQFAVN